MKAFLSFGSAVVFLFSATVADAGTLRGKVTIQGKSDSKDVVVYVDGIRGGFPPPEVPPEMNHINLRFDPPVLAVLKGTTVPFPNSDPVFHSAFSLSSSNPFDLGIYAKGRQKSVHFANPGMVEVFCHIHSHMHAFILVLENPYFAVTDTEGNYLIENIPEGTHTIRAWQSSSVGLTQKTSIHSNNTTVLDFKLGP